MYQYKMVSETGHDLQTVLAKLKEVSNKEEALSFLALFDTMKLVVEGDVNLDFKNAWIETLNTTQNINNTIIYMKKIFSSLMEEK